MNRRRKILFALAIVAVLIALWLLRPRPSSAPTPVPQEIAPGSNSTIKMSYRGAKLPARKSDTLPPSQEYREIVAQNELKRRAMTNEALLWRTPLRYYGKVIDENGNPISGARATYGGNALDPTLTQEIRNEGFVTSDQRGIFKIEGLYGVGLMIEVSHPDYYAYPTNSTGFSVRSLPQKGYFSDTEDKAEVFRMHSKGNPVPLILRRGGFHTPNDGSIANFPLRGNTRAEILGQLQIQGWSGLRSQANPYDWKIQLNLPDGGIVESTNYFDFVAPETGYSKSVNFQVSGSEMARKQFFLKLPSGYIRFKLQVIMGKDMFVSGDYYYNPDGSRNLEPSQEIRPTQ
jgi:hypothetical protein